MKYLIIKSNVSNAEIKARMRYIYDLFYIYTLVDSVNSNKDITILTTIPENAIDLFMIVGPDKRTDEYLQANYKRIKEKNIVIIACNTFRFSSLGLLKNKNVFIPRNEGVIDFYDGINYGFNFNITDEEIILYRNRNKDMELMLSNTFKRR